MSAIMELVGQNIKFYRQLRGLTQENLAEMVNVSCAYIGYLERGRKTPSLDVLVKIAEVLNVNPGQLLTSSQEEEDYELKKLLSLVTDKGSDFLTFINTVAEAYIKSTDGKRENQGNKDGATKISEYFMGEPL
jgi:transcriptional regulator with XRE-family HTH domain